MLSHKLRSVRPFVLAQNDGVITVNSAISLNAVPLIQGRSQPDAVNYSVLALTENSATLSAAPVSDALRAGDEVLLISMQAGGGGSVVNVGNYEFLRIQGIAGAVVTFAGTKRRYYGEGASDDTNIGTDSTNQKIMLQRVPNYTDVFLGDVSAGTLTCVAWNGLKGGVVCFRAKKLRVKAGSKLSTVSRGYRGGGANLAGESLDGFTSAHGGGDLTWVSTSRGGGGSHGAVGNNNVISKAYGVPDLSDKIYLGSGGGSSNAYNLAAGGPGGGIILVMADEIITDTGAGTWLQSNGTTGGNAWISGMGWNYGGHGAGGSVLLQVAASSFSASNIAQAITSYGTGVGRVAIFNEAVYGSVIGSSPAAFVSSSQPL